MGKNGVVGFEDFQESGTEPWNREAWESENLGSDLAPQPIQGDVGQVRKPLGVIYKWAHSQVSIK